jgi:8-amino-7-oxononanoate synthase
MNKGISAQLKHQLDELDTEGMLRRLRTIGNGSHHISVLEGQRVLNLSSNDYLGLTGDAAFKDRFLDYYHAKGFPDFSAASSRLLTGNSIYYDELEAKLSTLYQGISALCFNSGYHANMGILPAITSKEDLILSDKLIHASLVDGIRLSAATHIRYRHLDYEQLGKILNEKRHLYRRVIIVTESVFSMDGDCVDLPILVELKERYDCLLYVDEAHAVGVKGKSGLGLAEAQGVQEQVDMMVGTFGKALASVGAYLITCSEIRDWLINRCRTLIYTTALPPVNLAWSCFVLNHLKELFPRRQQLATLTEQMVASFNRLDIHVKSDSPIIPVVVGDHQLTIRLADYLLKKGFLVMPIRPPTVPEGTSRLRLSLAGTMEWEQLSEVPGLIAGFLKNP